MDYISSDRILQYEYRMSTLSVLHDKNVQDLKEGLRIWY